MCLILFAYDAHPGYRLILAANRDEFYDRPAAALEFWKDHPQILAGRDLKMSGTWMGITRQGRIAAITNYREPGSQNINAPSRGHLISDFLCSHRSAPAYLEKIKDSAHQYNGFNMLIGDSAALYYFSNRGSGAVALEPGVHGLSNHLLNTPWPKVANGRKRLAALLDSPEQRIFQGLTALLQDREVAPDDRLPDTGVGYATEKMLSPMFIASPGYGTRCSTVLTVDRHQCVRMTELTWQPGHSRPVLHNKREFTFTMDRFA